MIARNVILAVAVAAAAGGCSIFTDAHNAQKEVDARASGADEIVLDSFDFRGRSLSWLVDFAMTNRPVVVAARLAVENSRLALKELAADAPIVSKTPWTSAKVTGNAGFDAVSEQSRHLDGIEFSTDGDFSGSISLSVLVYDFGRYDASAKAAAESLVASELALAETGFTVFEEVAGAYFTMHEKAALLEVARTNEFEYAEHLRRARDLLEAGEAQTLDVTRARLDLSQAREATIAASNEVAVALAEMTCALGVEIGEADSSELLPDSGEALGSVRSAFGSTSACASEMFAFARTNAPAVAVARARLRSASARVDYALADLLPSVSATTSLGWADPMWMWRGGVSVVQSFFQGFRKKTAVERSVVEMRSAAASVDEAEQQLSRSLELAVAERDNAAKAKETAIASLADAGENLKTVKAQYLEGDADRIDFTSSVAAYTAALGNRISAFYRAQTAEARLFRLMGRVPAWAERTITEVE